MADTNITYSYSQRMTWLQNHTRIDPDRGEIEMWNILKCIWQQVTPDTLGSVYPVIVRGVLSTEEAWQEITVAAPQPPDYAGDRPPVEHYGRDAIVEWFLKNHRLSSDGQSLQRRSPIDRQWYDYLEGENGDWGPRDFEETHSRAFLSRTMNFDKKRRLNPPVTEEEGKIPLRTARKNLLFGAMGAQENSEKLGVEVSQTIDFDPQAFAKWEETNVQMLSSRRIAEAFLGLPWPMTPVSLRLLTASLKAAGWIPQRNGTARWWVKDQKSKNDQLE